MMEQLHDHPAIRAWRRARPDAPIPVRVERLTKGGSNAVFRFHYRDPAGRPTIAKQRWRQGADTERVIYQRILPSLPIPPVRYVGFANDDDPKRAWLFIDDVGGDPYRSSDRDHRTLAARWLAEAHAFYMTGSPVAPLPERGCDHYLQLLQWSSTAIASHLRSNDFNAIDRRILVAISQGLAELEQNWHTLERACDEMPRSLVHGDFVAKNCRVQSATPSDVGLFVFDWETAGWGPPAVDLATNALGDQGLALDYATYARVIRAAWGKMTTQELKRAIRVGDALRVVAAIKWASVCLGHGWLPNDEMRFYVPHLHRALRLVQSNRGNRRATGGSTTNVVGKVAG